MKIEDVIAAACEELQISYSENALWFKILVNQVLKTFRSGSNLRNYTYISEIEDSRLPLPNSWNQVLSVSTCEGQTYCESYDFEIQNDYAIFMSALEIADGTKFVISYKGYPVDEDGTVYLKDEWERMLVAYIGWKYSRRHFDRYAPVMDNYKREYQLQRAANL
jgi:hypothetical protein